MEIARVCGEDGFRSERPDGRQQSGQAWFAGARFDMAAVLSRLPAEVLHPIAPRKFVLCNVSGVSGILGTERPSPSICLGGIGIRSTMAPYASLCQHDKGSRLLDCPNQGPSPLGSPCWLPAALSPAPRQLWIATSRRSQRFSAACRGPVGPGPAGHVVPFAARARSIKFLCELG
jgi:hypothetical protein